MRQWANHKKMGKPITTGKLSAVWPIVQDKKRRVYLISSFFILVFFFGYLFWSWRQYQPETKLDAAIAEFQRAIALEPDNVEAYRYLARAFRQAGQPEKAIEAYNQAITINPEAIWPHLELGDFYRAEGDFKQAEMSYRQAIEIKESSGANIKLARLYREQANYGQALSYAQRAGQIASNDNDRGAAYQEQALIYGALQQLDEAEAQYRLALTFLPDSPWVHTAAGDFYYYYRRDIEKATKLYRKATTLLPAIAWPHLALAKIFFDTNQLTEGMVEIEQALQREPISANVHQRAGQLLLERHLPDQAKPYFERAIQLDPENIGAYINLAQVYRQQGVPEPALVYAQQAESLARNDDMLSLAHLEQAFVYQLQSKNSEAQRHFSLAAELAPDNAEVQFAAGEFYYRQLEQPERAVPYYRQVVTLSPYQAKYQLALGQALLATGHQQEAISTLTKSLSLAKGDPTIYLAVGRLAGEQENWSEMVRIYEDALAHGAASVDIYLQLGDAYKQLGYVERAYTSYQQAAQLDPNHPEVQQRLTQTP